MAEASRIQHVFIVRIWQEPGGVAMWRGSVEHVPGAARTYFTSLADLYKLIIKQMDSPNPPNERTEPSHES